MISHLRKQYRIFAERSTLAKLGRAQDPGKRALAAALQQTVQGETTGEEDAWTGKIEALRKELNASTREIRKTDYGAGSASDPSLQKGEGREVVSTVGEIARLTSKPPFWSLLLLKLIRHFQPAACLEMGTSLGISGAYQAAGLEMNGKGQLVTLEGAAMVAQLARENFQVLGLDRVRVVVGRFQEALPEVLAGLQPVDYVFVDGHHDEEATQAYFEQLKPYLAPHALLIFDDIAWSDGMQRAWAAIIVDEHIRTAVDLHNVGLCIWSGKLDRTGEAREVIRLPSYRRWAKQRS